MVLVKTVLCIKETRALERGVGLTFALKPKSCFQTEHVRIVLLIIDLNVLVLYVHKMNVMTDKG